MDSIGKKIDDLRNQYPILREDVIPLDIFSFFEIDLGLDPIPFDGLTSRYQVEAAIKADFTGLYVDAEQYLFMERGPVWKLNRLRFTIAHELAHYFLHQSFPQDKDFSSVTGFARWSSDYGGKKYIIEQEANEFAGRLLVPYRRLNEMFEEFADEAKKIIPHFLANEQLRYQFSERVAPRFGVNTGVIEVRLDRENLWPVS